MWTFIGVRDGLTDRQTDKVIYRGAYYAPKNMKSVKATVIIPPFCKYNIHE